MKIVNFPFQTHHIFLQIKAVIKYMLMTNFVYINMLLGRLNASKTPVIIAEQSLIVLAVYYALTFVICAVMAGEVPARALAAVPLAVLYLFAVTGVCMLFSALAPKGSMAMMAAFLLMVVLQIFMQNVSFSTEPWYSLGYECGILGDYPLGNQTEFDVDVFGNARAEDYVPDVSIACVVMAVYALISTALAVTVFRYRNMRSR